MDTGFSVRGELEDGTDPTYASVPELVDCKITDMCDNGCTYCYMKSGEDGKHCSVEDYCKLLEQWARLGVQQVALGGGEPTMHPHFIPIVTLTRKADVVPNYSTNGRHLTKEILDVSRDYCGAVAVSWHNPPEVPAVHKLIEHGVKTNIHYILSEQEMDSAIRFMRLLDSGFFPGLNAVIFLRLKPVGRATGEEWRFTDECLNHFFAETEKTILTRLVSTHA